MTPEQTARRGRGRVRHAPLRVADPGQGDLRRVPQARARENRRWHSALPHPDLAHLPIGTDGYAGYWAAMTFALRFAEVNRSRILDVVEAGFGAHTRVGRFERVVDVHRN